MSGNLAVSTINGVDISVSPVATQAFANSLLYEAVVTGSAVTSINFPLLDINTHKSYRVEIEMINAVASTSTIYCFINGDTTLANYYSQTLYSDGATNSPTRVNNPTIITLDASARSSFVGTILKNTSGWVSIHGDGIRFIGTSSTLVQSNHLTKTAIVTNITQLTFTSSVASAIGVGSKIRIYRGDV